MAAWTVAASACVGLEALFLVRLVHLLLTLQTDFPNLPQPSWHALSFSIGFLVVGAAMTYLLVSARQPSDG
jgi:hypothetical protein